MSYSTEMSLLMYHIRSEFYKSTNSQIVDILSNFSQESIVEAIKKFEHVQLDINNVRQHILNIPINIAKKLLSLTRSPEIRELIEAYMLFYEFYNLNTLLRARLNKNLDKDLFLFDYSTVTTKDNLLNLEKVDDVKKVYFDTISFHKIRSKTLKDILRTISLDKTNELLLYSSIEYYRNLISKKSYFGMEFLNLVKIKAFYEIMEDLAKIKFIAGVDVEKYIQELGFLGDKQEVLTNLFLSSKENFVKKCIDFGIFPTNFLMTDIDDIDKFKNTIIKEKCRNIIVGLPMSPATIVAIIMLREIDMKNYFSILGGYVSGFSFEKVRQFLVL